MPLSNGRGVRSFGRHHGAHRTLRRRRDRTAGKPPTRSLAQVERPLSLRPAPVESRRPQACNVDQATRQGRVVRNPVGFQNAGMALGQRFQAAISYSLRRPPRIGRRRILPRTGSGPVMSGAAAATAVPDADAACCSRRSPGAKRSPPSHRRRRRCPPVHRPAHRAIDRRTELESRAVPRRLGRCGWCGSTELHKDCSASRPPC